MESHDAAGVAHQRCWNKNDPEKMTSAADRLALAATADSSDAPLFDPWELLPSRNDPSATLEQLDALARVLAEAEPQAAAAAAVEAGVELLGASGGAVATLESSGDVLELMATTGYPPDLVEVWRHIPLSLDVPLALAASSRELVDFYVDGTNSLLTGESDGPPRDDAPASIAVPLVADGETIGAFGFSFGSLPEAERQHGLMLLLARMCGDALGRARRAVLFVRLQRLQALAAALTRSVTPKEVADVLVKAAIDDLGADGAFVARLTESGDTLEVLAAEGYANEPVDRKRRIQLTARLPAAEAVRSLEPVVCRTRAEILEPYPSLAEEVRALGLETIVALPLLTDHQSIGAMRINFRTPRVIDHEQFRFMRSFAQVGGQTLDRALRARQQDRTLRLQRLTARLSHALTPQEVGTAIVESGIELLGAAGGGVVEATGQGTLRLLANAGLPAELLGESPEVSLAGSSPLGQLARRGQSLLFASLSEAAQEEPWLAEQLARFGYRAVAFTTFEGKGDLQGGLLLVFEDEVGFTPEDGPFLRTIADLFVQALERSELHALVDQSRRRFETLLERLQEGVLTVDRRLRVEYANPEAVALLGGPAIVGRKLPLSLGGFPLRRFVQKLPRNDGTPVETRFAGGEGATYEVVGIGGHESTVLVLRDVSARARRELAEKEFVQNAAHELRTPLAAIASAVDALELGAKDEVWARDYFITSVASEVERLGRLLTALLTLAHAQSDPDWLTLEPVDVAPALHDVARTVPAAPAVRVVVHCPEDAQVMAEPTLLAAALGNLAENAARYVQAGTITLSCGEPCDGVCTISVRDTGPGLDAETQAHVFERFSRDDHDGPGHGLGLPIVRAMAVALHGSLSISSEAGNGTDVTLTLPAP